MTTLGSLEPSESKRIRVDGFDFDCVRYDKDGTDGRVWLLRVDQMTPHHHEYLVLDGKFFTAAKHVPINSPRPGGIVLEDEINIDPKEKQAALEAIKELENPSKQV